MVSPATPRPSCSAAIGNGPCPSPQRLDCIPADERSHSIGTVRSAPDGTLWVGSGDASVQRPTRSRCGPTTSTASPGRSSTSTATVTGCPGHPFCPSRPTSRTSARSSSPRASATRSGSPCAPAAARSVGDVGWNTTRRDRLWSRPGRELRAGRCYEGPDHTPGYRDLPSARRSTRRRPRADAGPMLRLPATADGAARSWRPARDHRGAVPGRLPGLVVLRRLRQGCVRRIRHQRPQDHGPSRLRATASYAVDLESTPDGDLAYVYFGDGAIEHRPLEESSTGTNRTPDAVATRRRGGRRRLRCSFNADVSTDPDGDARHLRLGLRGRQRARHGRRRPTPTRTPGRTPRR